MDRFVAQNRVRYVTLLRPEQPAAAVAVKKVFDQAAAALPFGFTSAL